jgi:hypothetical protein
MTIKSIKVGNWYRTKVGIGQALDTTNFRGHVRMKIVFPFPRGLAMVAARDVNEEVEAPVEGTPPLSWS